ncbi:SUMF1/EgtB/PvdO family nonheme iron enzyme, partial [Opitutales bacterium]|nr:SUMF1/EgtB/PvdO family nonheme iron enzyme [Opitutales bacterium]
MKLFKLTCKFVLAAILASPWVQGNSSEIDFTRDVQPILEHNCVSCHREDNAKGDVRLDTKAATLAGDDVLVPGDPEASSLYWTTTLPLDDELIMPPIKNEEKDYPLTDAEKAVLKQWIVDGAEWPEEIVLEPRKRLPKTISFVDHVQPILELNCVACHYEGKVKADLRLDTKAYAFATDYVISPGNALESDLYVLCTLPMDDEMFMPPAPADPLSSGDLYTLRRWIDEGADWPEEVTLAPKKKSLTILGTMPKDLYQELGFSEGPVTDEFSEYEEEISTSDLAFELVPIEGGEFTMGSPLDDSSRGENEWPAHQVEVSDFWMGKYELTWDLYELWMLNIDRDNRAYKKMEETKADALTDAVTKPTAPYTDMTFGMGKSGFPAICMTQLSAKMYCMWLSARTGRFYRLPTEAEWEYACKAGSDTAYNFGDDSESLPDHSWHLKNSFFQYQSVGGKPANGFGLFDMHGNVWEWTLDQFAPPPSKAPSEKRVNPMVVPTSLYPRVVKGGSWDDGPQNHR